MNRNFLLGSLSLLSILLISGALSQAVNASNLTSSSTSPTSLNFTQVSQGKISTTGQLKKIGTTFIALNSHQVVTSPTVNETEKSLPLRLKPSGVSSLPSSQPPLVSNLDNIMNNPGGATTAKGVNALDNYEINGVDYEPPDQGLCVGNGYVIDVVNTVLRIYTTPSFTSFSSDISPNTIDGLAISAFTSDPRCLFDQDTGHWFLTQLLINFSGLGQGFEYIAVSQTPDPWGSWNVYALNVTDSFPKTASYPDQTNDPGCPCFGDQPLLGASRDALVISTNEFNIFNSTYNGAQVYLFDKLGMALGYNFVSFVHLNTLGVPTPDGRCLPSGGVFCWTSVNPATSPTPSQYDNSNGGTEYALSTLDFQFTGDNRLAVWSFADTQSLHSFAPDVSYSITVIGGLERYVDPLDSNGNGFFAPQKSGPIPAGDTVYSNHPHAPTYGCKGQCKEGLIQTNGDQMFDTVVYAQGSLWGAVNTVVREQIGSSISLHAGVAYWVVSALGNDFSIANQGYVAAKNEDIMFPSIGVGPTGSGVLTFTLTGTDYYPSSAYGLVSKSSSGLIGHSMNVADMGKSPYDATTEYQCVSGTCNPSSGLFYFPRWGDYTWAVWYNGKVYFATEYIQYSNCVDATYKIDPSCGDTRGPLANWGTSLNSIGT